MRRLSKRHKKWIKYDMNAAGLNVSVTNISRGELNLVKLELFGRYFMVV